MKKISRITLLTIIILFSLLGLMVVYGYLLSLDINLERERFSELAGKTMLDIHHSIEDDELLSDQLITILRSTERGQDVSPLLLAAVVDDIQLRIDSICSMNGISLQSDFVIYSTKDESVLVDSRGNHSESADFTTYSVKAGWRIRQELGQGKYRIGLIYYNRYVFMLKEMSTLLILSGLLYLLLITGVTYALINLKKQKELAEQKNHFINNLTHELNTPIFSTSLLHRVFKEKMESMDHNSQVKYLAMMEGENEKLKQQVDKVLEIAQLDHGKLKLDIQDCDLHGIIEKNMDVFSVLVREKHGKVAANLRASKHIIAADPLHITNALYNLVDNSIKYSPDKPMVTIESRDIPGYVVLRIRDQGIGIHKKYHDAIFENFFRVGTGNIHAVKGSGLGLSYVKMIVEQHGGRISIESKPGKGTTFDISFPIL